LSIHGADVLAGNGLALGRIKAAESHEGSHLGLLVHFLNWDESTLLFSLDFALGDDGTMLE
jgi:hypothetical protein